MPTAAPASTAAEQGPERMIPAIDVHARSVPHGWPQLPGPEPRLWLDVTDEAEATVMIGSRQFRRINSSAGAVDVRLTDMDADAVEMQVVSANPLFFAYDSSPADFLAADERLRGNAAMWLVLDQAVAAS